MQDARPGPERDAALADPPALRDRLERALAGIDPSPPIAGTRASARASVLVPVVLAREPFLLLTRRSPALRRHPNQVSFPGGRVETDLLVRLAEVAEILVLPFANLLDPGAARRERACLRGIWHEYWVWHHPDHLIWGATAAILSSLADRLRRQA